MIGRTLNERYRIDSEIGQGGMGTVYCGYDTALEREVAIKVLTKSGLGTEGRGKLVSEAQMVVSMVDLGFGGLAAGDHGLDVPNRSGDIPSITQGAGDALYGQRQGYAIRRISLG